MKVLLIGGGGREHALAWKCAQSAQLKRLYCAPGNAGIADIAECLPIKANDIENLLAFAKNERIDLTLVGPEAPLIGGLADAFSTAGLKAFGPCAKAAQLEGSKAFAKALMAKMQVPTAEFQTFTSAELAIEYVKKQYDAGKKLVVKASGEALGKGAVVTDTEASAIEAVEMMMVRKELGTAGDAVVIEEKLSGPEASMMAFCDGQTAQMLQPSQDFKRIGDGDTGLNTGGMGSYSPVPFVSEKIQDGVLNQIVLPTIQGLAEENIEYKGVLYPGVLVQDGQPYNLEFNCRFGDPETQCLMPLLETDLLDICMAVVEGRLKDIQLRWKPGFCVCVVLASGGYPGSYETGYEIDGLAAAAKMPDVQIFHAGTKLKGNQMLTSGGRVLGVTASGATLASAREKAYAAVQGIKYEKMIFRRDIALNACKFNETSI